MRTIEEIERMSMEELERIASSKDISIPEGLDDRISGTLTAAAFHAQERPAARTRHTIIGIVASAVAAACLGMVLVKASQPKDTFTDPMLAYAQLEQTFQYIQTKMGKGLEIAAGAEPVIERTSEIFNGTK